MEDDGRKVVWVDECGSSTMELDEIILRNKSNILYKIRTRAGWIPIVNYNKEPFKSISIDTRFVRTDFIGWLLCKTEMVWCSSAMGFSVSLVPSRVELLRTGAILCSVSTSKQSSVWKHFVLCLAAVCSCHCIAPCKKIGVFLVSKCLRVCLSISVPHPSYALRRSLFPRKSLDIASKLEGKKRCR